MGILDRNGLSTKSLFDLRQARAATLDPIDEWRELENTQGITRAIGQTGMDRLEFNSLLEYRAELDNEIEERLLRLSTYNPLERTRDIETFAGRFLDPRLARTENIESLGRAIDPRLERTRDIQAAPRGADLNVMDNILSGFDTYTYKWTLYAAPWTVHNNRQWNPLNAIIIAESGASGDFFINEIELSNLVGINPVTRFMPHAKFSFDIQEPNGATFMDRLYNATQELGIENHFKVPYYMELEFYGYDSNGKKRKITDNYVWSITFINMNVSTTESGSIYSFEAIAADDGGVIDDVSNMAHDFTIDDVENVGEFFDQLEYKLNKQESYYGGPYGFLYDRADEFKFVVPDNIREMDITPPDSSFESNRMTVSGYDTGKKQIVVIAGTDISEIISHLMVLTPEWSKYVSAESVEDAINEFSTLWKIETQIEILGYDTSRNDYAKRFIFNLIPFDALRTNKNLSDAEKLARAGSLSGIFDINKVYHYTFTGLNTEVLNFDFNLDYMWYKESPFGGLSLRTDGPDAGSLDEFISQTSRIRQRISSLEASINSGTALVGIADQLANATQALNAIQTASGEQLGDRISRLSQEALESSRFKINLSNTERFIEDIPTANEREYVYSSPPERYTKRRTDIINLLGMEGGSGLTQKAVAQYLSFYGAHEMTNVSIDIKGDPYWLGKNKYSRSLQLIDEHTPELADYIYKDNMFIINMNSPGKPDSSGRYTAINNKLYTALYQVISSTHRFSDGMYTCTLNAIKDSNTDIRNLIREL